ncbi:MAG: sugar phosphate isomerase/epimerase [Planctomycetes bacterium]|nr:sugar phosphate isomerase/epimerase [Planctomycetota bacterium]MBL7142836.1 sugar phosphate isomerase/epimerase [Phycisphaerae bacterium]
MLMQRRQFLHMTSVLPWVRAAVAFGKQENLPREDIDRIPVSLCLNAYSFNGLLKNGEMSLEALFRFAKDTGFQGVDLTAYYIPGYPDVPTDKVLYNIKRMAFRLGLALTGTGGRNNFTLADPEQRKLEKQLVKNWVIAASKLGIPQVRIFDGTAKPKGYSREEITDWLIDDMKECAAFGGRHGVMICYQNHNNFTTNAAQAIEIVERVDSEWLGLMLDIGSLPEGDVYQEIERLIPYAVTWQVKEMVQTRGMKVKTDFVRLMNIVRRSGYRGYFPLETLGEGDPFQKVRALYREANSQLT